MGCVESRLESDLQTNIFHVVNVNERGQRQRSARLEVTDSHLILHQRGHGPIRWPLRCLRRYGFDAEQFSFESGRRSPSGPGIYNFKCRRAEALFNILQYQIQNIAEDTASRDLASHPTADTRELSRADSRTSTSAIDFQGYLEPITSTRVRAVNWSGRGPVLNPPSTGATGANGGIGAFPSSMRSPGSPAPLSPPSTSIFINPEANDVPSRGGEREEAPPLTPGLDLRGEPPPTPQETSRNIIMNYIDRTVSYINHSERPCSYSSSGSDRPIYNLNHGDRSQSYVTGSQCDRPISILKSIDSNVVELNKVDELMRCQHLYMNVDTDHVYANLGLDKDMPIVLPRASGGSGSSHSGTTTTTDTEQPINYIQVDLDRGSDSSQAIPLSPLITVAAVVQEFPRSAPSNTTASSLEYATIDFNKTEALISTAKEAALWKAGDDGPRRSRHNSTFSAVTSFARHNSTLSD